MIVLVSPLLLKETEHLIIFDENEKTIMPTLAGQERAKEAKKAGVQERAAAVLALISSSSSSAARKCCIFKSARLLMTAISSFAIMSENDSDTIAMR